MYIIMDKRYIIYNLINTKDIDYNDILNIIISYNIHYTQNINGIFINLSTLDDNLIDNIYDKLLLLINTDKNYTTAIQDNLTTTVPQNEIIFNKHISTDKIKLSTIDKLLLSLSKETISI